jgi:regulator of replication initiation timing
VTRRAIAKEHSLQASHTKRVYEDELRRRETENLERLADLRAQIAQLKVDHSREMHQLALENENLKARLANQAVCRRCHRPVN